MRNQENKKRINKEWYLRVKDTPEHKAQKRDWYLKNRDRISKLNKEKRALMPKRILKTEEEKRRDRGVWVEKNREKLNSLARKWREQHLLKQRQYAKKYYHSSLSLKLRHSRLVADAKGRGYVVNLSLEDFSGIVATPCAYCGESEKRIGIDRIDNTKDYTKENSAPCCKTCNYMKKTMSVQDFINHIKKIFLYNDK